jgi:hypothetical protein
MKSYKDYQQMMAHLMRQGYNKGGYVRLKIGGYVNKVPIDTGKVKPGYITGQELEELTGIPNLKNKAKELMYAPKESKRQKNIFGDFYRKDLKARYFNIGQGGKFGTLHYKKPTAEQIKEIRNYHLRTGAKYGLTDETIKGMKQFYNDPTLRKFIRKGEIVPEAVLKAKGININTAANITYRLAQHLNGKEFTNVNVDIPRNKTVGKKIFETIAKAPFGNVYQQKAYQNALNEISEQLGPNYFEGSKPNMDLMKREARRILNREGVPTFDPTVKGSTGFNINEIIGVKTGARVKGMAPYSQFVNIMEGKLNAEQYGNFVRQFEKFSNRMQTENKADVIKDYNKYKKNFLKNNPSVKDTDVPKFSLQSPEKVYGKNRIKELAEEGLDLNKSYDEIGYTVDVGKKTRTLKEFITNPQNIARLKKFGKIGAGVGAGLTLPSVVAAREPDTKETTSILPTVAGGGAGAAAIGTKTGRSLLGKAFRTLGTPLAGTTLAGTQIASNIGKGENIADAVIDPIVGLELSFPGLFRENISKITSNPRVQQLLTLGRFGRALTPVGLGITAAGAGVDLAKFTKDRINELRSMSPENRQKLQEQSDAFAFNEFAAAGGGIAKLAGKESGPPPEKGPDSEGLASLLKNVKKR